MNISKTVEYISKNGLKKIGTIEKITKSKKSHPGDGSWANGVKGGNW